MSEASFDRRAVVPHAFMTPVIYGPQAGRQMQTNKDRASRGGRRRRHVFRAREPNAADLTRHCCSVLK